MATWIQRNHWECGHCGRHFEQAADAPVPVAVVCPDDGYALRRVEVDEFGNETRYDR